MLHNRGLPALPLSHVPEPGGGGATPASAAARPATAGLLGGALLRRKHTVTETLRSRRRGSTWGSEDTVRSRSLQTRGRPPAAPGCPSVLPSFTTGRSAVLRAGEAPVPSICSQLLHLCLQNLIFVARAGKRVCYPCSGVAPREARSGSLPADLAVHAQVCGLVSVRREEAAEQHQPASGRSGVTCADAKRTQRKPSRAEQTLQHRVCRVNFSHRARSRGRTPRRGCWVSGEPRPAPRSARSGPGLQCTCLRCSSLGFTLRCRCGAGRASTTCGFPRAVRAPASGRRWLGLTWQRREEPGGGERPGTRFPRWPVSFPSSHWLAPADDPGLADNRPRRRPERRRGRRAGGRRRARAGTAGPAPHVWERAAGARHGRVPRPRPL